MLDAVSGTQTATARPASRGGRGARERILTAATTLFHRGGIHATGVERLTEHAHVSKRTFYQHFSSKNDLVEEYLRRIHHAGGAPREQAIDTADASPRSRLLAIFDSAPGSRFRGCPFHNAAVEAADAMPGVEDIVHEHKLDFTARIIQAATEAGARDPYRLGNQLAVLFEGALALATSLNDTSPCYTRDRPPKRSSMLPPSAQGNDEAEHPLMAVRQLEPSARLTPSQAGTGGSVMVLD